MGSEFELIDAHFTAAHPAQVETVREGWNQLGEIGRRLWMDNPYCNAHQRGGDLCDDYFPRFSNFEGFLIQCLQEKYRTWRITNAVVTSNFKDKIRKLQWVVASALNEDWETVTGFPKIELPERTWPPFIHPSVLTPDRRLLVMHVCDNIMAGEMDRITEALEAQIQGGGVNALASYFPNFERDLAGRDEQTEVTEGWFPPRPPFVDD
jgi:hypothetical protein